LDVFDLIATPDRIRPSLTVAAVFVGVAAVLLLGCLVEIRRGRRAPDWALAVSLCLLFLAGLSAWQEIPRAKRIRTAVLTHSYRTVEGCLEFFVPHSGGRYHHRDEAWSVAGQRFHYSYGDITYVYHATQAAGGIVHPTSHVKVWFVPGGARNYIVRIEARQNACPPAPPPG
jgi:hypothetical protein